MVSKGSKLLNDAPMHLPASSHKGRNESHLAITNASDSSSFDMNFLKYKVRSQFKAYIGGAQS